MNMTFFYEIKIKTANGLALLKGDVHTAGDRLQIRPCLPEGHILSCRAAAKIQVFPEEKLFFNGFQTWSYCPEYSKWDRIPGINRIPRGIVRTFHLDRYGDYHFVNYPDEPGILHGVSYAYIRDEECYRFFGSLDEKPGYTLIKYNATRSMLILERDCKGLACGGEFPAFDLCITQGSQEEVYDRWFAMMDIHPLTDQKIKGYSSWYNRYEDISRQSIAEDLAGCRGVMEPGDLFQIDDGWEPKVGEWLETDPEKFPEGLEPVAAAIHKAGFRAGLWLAPFVCKKDSRIVKEHPDWLLKVEGRNTDTWHIGPKGKPWYDGCNWGGFYSLDIDNPEVLDYLRQVFRRVFDEWGFDLVKLDFLYGAAPFGTETESRAARMIRAMDFLREVCGDHAILGCGVPVWTAFGKVEYCRVSCDVGLDWNDKKIMQKLHKERVSTKQAIENSTLRRPLNGRAHLNDPDVFFLRENNIRLTLEERKLLADSNLASGGVFLTSDAMGDYNEGQVAVYKDLAERFKKL